MHDFYFRIARNVSLISLQFVSVKRFPIKTLAMANAFNSLEETHACTPKIFTNDQFYSKRDETFIHPNHHQMLIGRKEDVHHHSFDFDFDCCKTDEFYFDVVEVLTNIYVPKWFRVRQQRPHNSCHSRRLVDSWSINEFYDKPEYCISNATNIK